MAKEACQNQAKARVVVLLTSTTIAAPGLDVTLAALIPPKNQEKEAANQAKRPITASLARPPIIAPSPPKSILLLEKEEARATTSGSTIHRRPSRFVSSRRRLMYSAPFFYIIPV